MDKYKSCKTCRYGKEEWDSNLMYLQHKCRKNITNLKMRTSEAKVFVCNQYKLNYFAIYIQHREEVENKKLIELRNKSNFRKKEGK